MRLLALRAETMQAMRRLKLPCDDITPIGLWGSDMYLIGVNNDQFEVLRLWNVQTEDVTPATLRDLHTESTAIPTSPSAGNPASGARSSAKGAPSAAPASTASPSEQATSARSARSAPGTSAPESASPAATLEQQVERDAGPSSASTASRGRPSLDIQPAFEAVVQAPAPEAPSPRASSSSAATESAAGNGSAGAPSVTSSSGGSARRDGPDLKLESSMGTATGASRTQEGRPTKAAKSETESRSSAKESAKESAKDSKDSGSNAGKLRMTVDGEHLYAEIKGGKIVLKDRTYDSLAHARDSIRRERNKVAVWEYFDEGVKAWRVLNRD
jgi:hypothetical protein